MLLSGLKVLWLDDTEHDMARNNIIILLLLPTMICTVMTEYVNSTLEDVLRIAPYNSRGFSDNRKLVISDLLLFNDIVLIQEYWLFDEQLHQVNICNNHTSVAVSGMDSASGIHVGRPYGGVAIIWNKCINTCIKPVYTESKRLTAILFTYQAYKILIITVYMPYDSGTKDISMVEQFSEVLDGIANLIRIYDPSDNEI